MHQFSSERDRTQLIMIVPLTYLFLNGRSSRTNLDSRLVVNNRTFFLFVSWRTIKWHNTEGYIVCWVQICLLFLLPSFPLSPCTGAIESWKVNDLVLTLFLSIVFLLQCLLQPWIVFVYVNTNNNNKGGDNEYCFIVLGYAQASLLFLNCRMLCFVDRKQVL